MLMPTLTFALIFWPGVFFTSADAAEVRVAVAANFLATFNEMVPVFEQRTGDTVLISPGSTGKLYVQIKNGAPFDVFFAADSKRPRLLEEEGIAVKHSRFTYAVGRLTLWSADPALIRGNGKSVLDKGSFTHLALANPKTAPYGRAAQQTLKALRLWDHVKDRLVQGENIGQAFQFVASRNAQLGFVALSQVLDPKINGAGSRWDVPATLYDPLEQQVVLLKKGQKNAVAIALLEYVKGEKGRAAIKRFGYGLD